MKHQWEKATYKIGKLWRYYQCNLCSLHKAEYDYIEYIILYSYDRFDQPHPLRLSQYEEISCNEVLLTNLLT